MSLAERLKNSGSENEATRNYRAAKIFQCTLFGEPEMVEEVEVKRPVVPMPEDAVPSPRPLADPRPDLVEDSELWTRFLQLAEDENKQLTGILHGFRCQGTRIVLGRSGYVLRPELDPDKGWKNRQEYEKERDKWLMPHIDVIAELLKKL